MVPFSEARKCGDRRLGDFLEALFLPGLVEGLIDVLHIISGAFTFLLLFRI
jgi:hypothetical protein